VVGLAAILFLLLRPKPLEVPEMWLVRAVPDASSSARKSASPASLIFSRHVPNRSSSVTFFLTAHP
jgi:hypothetical protein